MKRNTTINLQAKMRPLRNDKGEVLNDLDFVKEAVSKIDEYSKSTGKPPKISPKFVAWLKQGIKYVDGHKMKNMVQYKDASVMKELDYDLVCANTEARNAKLEKKGEFKSKVTQRIKGVAK